MAFTFRPEDEIDKRLADEAQAEGRSKHAQLERILAERYTRPLKQANARRQTRKPQTARAA